jgi:hypothetical protein
MQRVLCITGVVHRMLCFGQLHIYSEYIKHRLFTVYGVIGQASCSPALTYSREPALLCSGQPRQPSYPPCRRRVPLPTLPPLSTLSAEVRPTFGAAVAAVGMEVSTLTAGFICWLVSSRA